MPQRILVIRLGALGDLVLCCAAFAAIRAAHPQAQIALLTMPAFAAFAGQMPWFDRVLIDPRASGWRIGAWRDLARQVRAFAPERVYDLQGKRRQTILFNLLGGPLWGPEWSGAAPLCSHPRQWPPTPDMHFTDFVKAQLARAGLGDALLVGEADAQRMAWLDGDVSAFGLPDKFALLIPGCAPDRAYKRWPASHFAALVNALAARGIASVAIGTRHDAPALQAIKALAPEMVDLCGQTSLGQVAALARRAFCVVGNDTGPTHLAAAVGGRTVALLSDKVNPVWSAPRGPQAAWLQGKPLATLAPEVVCRRLEA